LSDANEVFDPTDANLSSFSVDKERSPSDKSVWDVRSVAPAEAPAIAKRRRRDISIDGFMLSPF
jgi:hypothetical protein